MKSILFYPKKWRKFLSMTVFFRCQFPSGALTGNLNVDHAMCVLSLNIINDKIFLLEWLWFYILALVSSASVIISVILVILPPSRKLWLRYKCLLFCTLRTFQTPICLPKCRRGKLSQLKAAKTAMTPFCFFTAVFTKF